MTMTASSRKFDMRSQPPYQIDFSNVATGKTVAATKRKVRFRFGSSHHESLQKGLTGVACRGEEHEVVIIMSALSGKRQVFCDGRNVHFSNGNRGEAFETSWTMGGGHTLKVRGCAALTLFEDTGYRSFDLWLDGLSYFAMPKLFELGSPKSTAGFSSYSAAPTRSVSSPKEGTKENVEEEEAWGYSNRRSTPHRLPPPSLAPQDATSSKDLDSVESPIVEAAPIEDLLSETALTTSGFFDSSFSSGPALLLDGNVSGNDDFAPVVATPALEDPQRSIVESHHLILSQYAPSSNPYLHPPQSNGLLLANESHTHFVPPPPEHSLYSPQPPTVAPPPPPAPSTSSFYMPYEEPRASVATTAPVQDLALQPYTPMPVLSMQPLCLDELEETSRRQGLSSYSSSPTSPLTEIDKAMASLVNLESLDDTVSRVTPEQRKAEQLKKQMAPKKSTPAPPRAADWRCGSQATMRDLQTHAVVSNNHSSTTTGAEGAPKKEIMRTHAFDASAAHAGMMVIYGAAAASGVGGPPSPYHSNYYNGNVQQSHPPTLTHPMYVPQQPPVRY